MREWKINIVPEIFEQEAQGSLPHLNRDIQFVLKVPTVNFMFRTLGDYIETF